MAAGADAALAAGRRGGGSGAPEWDAGIGGCESGFTLPTPGNPDIIWATCYGNTVTRFDARQGRARSVSPWMHTLDSDPVGLKYRCHWTPPLAIDPFDRNTVYYGCQVIFKTANAGQTWSVISPDLSTRDTSRIAFSGGVVGDNLGQFYGEVVFAIAPSAIRRGLIWAGTNDGKIWNTRDGGATWSDLSHNVTGMPDWGTIRRIEPSRFDPRPRAPWTGTSWTPPAVPLQTSDYGGTWSRIMTTSHGTSTGLRAHGRGRANRRGMLLPRGNGFHYSWTWRTGRFKDGLPAAPSPGSWSRLHRRGGVNLRARVVRAARHATSSSWIASSRTRPS